MRQRLLNLARERGEEFERILVRFGTERLLYRLSLSPYRDTFVLKGALLFAVWGGSPHRLTRDADFLGYGTADPARLEAMVREICSGGDLEEDGVRFDAATVRAVEIREADAYGGIRVSLRGDLAGARLSLQMDVGFGDAIRPEVQEIELPTLLPLPAPKLRAYPPEAVIAEKFETLVRFGLATTRVKDLYDLWFLASRLPFEGTRVVDAIGATFARRGTALPESTPAALSRRFADDPARTAQWRAFLGRTALPESPQPALGDAVNLVRVFLMPPAEASSGGRPFTLRWSPGGPWE